MGVGVGCENWNVTTVGLWQERSGTHSLAMAQQLPYGLPVQPPASASRTEVLEMAGKSLDVRMISTLFVVLMAGCVSAHGEKGASPSAESGTLDVITRAEIHRGQWSDTYALVRNLRPRWVQSRGIDSFVEPGHVQVYIDGTRLGGVELLRTVPTAGIDRLEWVDPVTAAGRWGMDHGHGVILITYSPAQDPQP